MFLRLAFIACLLAAPAPSAGASLDVLRAAIASAVTLHLGGGDVQVEIELLQAPDAVPEPLVAAPAAGARLGQPVRFVITPGAGTPFTVVARVTAIVGHAVSVRALARDAALTSADIEWREAALDGIPLQPLPQLPEILTAHTRRAIAEGEVLTRTTLVRPYAVRAGEAITLTVRSGPVEVRGVGRAVSSGYIGDVIRILPPGTRQPARARVTGPAAVEILQ